jgi:2',3'-cyclic-nucleotide 2'-phosphodiesterase (5'-nucleotidase family)
LPQARYEGRDVTSATAIDAAMAPALQRVRALQATELGVVLVTPLTRSGDAESALGNLFADALLERTPGADVAINNNVRGGLRADLPAGALTFGRLYDVFPFDNRLVTLTLRGAELESVLADEIRRNRRGTLGISGLRVRVNCSTQGLQIDLRRASGAPIAADEPLVVVAMDSLVLGARFSAVRLPDGFHVPQAAPVLREMVEDWVRERGGPLEESQFVDADQPRWEYLGSDLSACIAP